MPDITYDNRAQQYVAIEDDGTQRPATEEEIIEYQREMNNQGSTARPDWAGFKNPPSGWLS